MKKQIIAERHEVHAAEVALIGALKYTRYGEGLGVQQIESTTYEWALVENEMCVTYYFDGNDHVLCVGN